MGIFMPCFWMEAFLSCSLQHFAVAVLVSACIIFVDHSSSIHFASYHRNIFF